MEVGSVVIESEEVNFCPDTSLTQGHALNGCLSVCWMVAASDGRLKINDYETGCNAHGDKDREGEREWGTERSEYK